MIFIIVRRQTLSNEQQSQSQSYNTPGSLRLLRRTFRRLQNKEKIHFNVTILFRTSKKFVINLNIVRHENIDLRKVILYEKKRRKRKKVMYLYKDDKNKGQKRFFNSVKIVQIRKRTTVTKDIQRQHQLIV